MGRTVFIHNHWRQCSNKQKEHRGSRYFNTICAGKRRGRIFFTICWLNALIQTRKPQVSKGQQINPITTMMMMMVDFVGRRPSCRCSCDCGDSRKGDRPSNGGMIRWKRRKQIMLMFIFLCWLLVLILYLPSNDGLSINWNGTEPRYLCERKVCFRNSQKNSWSKHFLVAPYPPSLHHRQLSFLWLF